MKFKFTGEYEPMPFQDAISSKRKIEFEAESLSNILEQFEMFLRGCGYVFEGQLDIVNDFDENHEIICDDLDDVNQFFDRASEASRQLDEDVKPTLIWPFPDSKETYEQGGDPAHPPSYQPGVSKSTWENKVE
jgi:hypothetical protein